MSFRLFFKLIFVFLFAFIFLPRPAFATDPIPDPGWDPTAPCTPLTIYGSVRNNSYTTISGAVITVSNLDDSTIWNQATTGSDGRFSLTVSCNQKEKEDPNNETFRTFRIGFSYSGEGYSCDRPLDPIIAGRDDTTRVYDREINIRTCGPQTCTNPRFKGKVINSGFPNGVPYATVLYANIANGALVARYVTNTDGTYDIVAPCNVEEAMHPYPENEEYRTFSASASYTLADGSSCEGYSRHIVVNRADAMEAVVVTVGDLNLDSSGLCGPADNSQIPPNHLPPGQIGGIPGVTPTPTPTPGYPPVGPTPTGACITPKKFYGALSCETATVTSRNNMQVDTTSTPTTDGVLRPCLLGFCLNYSVKFKYDWMYNQDKYMFTQYRTFDEYHDNPMYPDTKWLVPMATGDIPASKKTIQETYNPVTKTYENFTPGLLSYFSPPGTDPTQGLQAYNNTIFWDNSIDPTTQKPKNTGMMLEKAAAILSQNNMSADNNVVPIPATQTILGGARWEPNFLPASFFAWQKIGCSISGRPGDKYCGADTSEYDFKKYINNQDLIFRNKTVEQLVTSNSLACAPTEKENSNGNLLASAIPFSTIQNNSGRVASASSVLGAVSCYVDKKLGSEETTCPFNNTQNKAVINLTGTTREDIECLVPATITDKASILAYANSFCNKKAETNIHEGTLIPYEEPILDLRAGEEIGFVRALFSTPGKTLIKKPKQTEGVQDVAGFGGTIAETDTKRLIDGYAYNDSCGYKLTQSMLDRPGNTQPPEDCFEPPETPIPTTTACGTGGVTWTNANNSPQSIPIPSSNGTTICGVITPIDPVSLTLARNPCHGNRSLDFPYYKIFITPPGGQRTEYTLLYPGSVDPVFYNIQVPIGSIIELAPGGGSWDDWGGSGSGAVETFTAQAGTNCKKGFLFSQPNYATGKDTQEFCGVTDSCSQYGVRKWSSLTSTCQNALTNNCHGGGDDVNLGCAGSYWACLKHGTSALGRQNCNTCPSSTENRINMANVVLTSVDCKGGRCLAVGTDVNDESTASDKGYIFSSEDNGSTWIARFRTGGSLFTVSFLNDDEVFVGGRYWFLGYSQNRGGSFVPQPPEDPAQTNLITAIKVGGGGVSGFAGASQGTHIWKLATRECPGNPGTTCYYWSGSLVQPLPPWEWEPSTSGTVSDFAISPDASSIVASGSPNRVFVKKPGEVDNAGHPKFSTVILAGTQCSAAHIRLGSVRFVDSSYQDFLVVGGNDAQGCVVKCSNYGASCFDATLPMATSIPPFSGMDYITYGSRNLAVAVGGNGTIIRSENLQDAWPTPPNFVTLTSGTAVQLNSVKIIDENRAVAVGAGGTILVTNNLNAGASTKWTKVEARQTTFAPESW